MLNYEYYKGIFNGSASKADFDKLIPYIEDFIQFYCESFIPQHKHKETFDDYDLDLQKACCYQLDLINQNGGINVFNGQSDTDVTAVSTSGYSVSARKIVDSFNSIPLSPLTKSLARMELSRRKLFSRCVY